jgi:hypothetical protein
MKAAFLIAGHHLLRVARNPGLILLLAAIPLTLAGIEYAAFGPSATSGKLPPIKVLFLDEDNTLTSRAVPQFFAGGPMKDYFELAPVDARENAKRLFESWEASALIVVPKGFQDALLNGRKAELQLYKNPIQTFSPEVVDSVLEMAAAIGNGLMAQAREPLARVQKLVTAGRIPSEEDIAEISRGVFRAGQRFARLGALQDITVAVERPSGSRGAGIGSDPRQFFSFLFPGLVLFGLMFISQALAARLLRDRTLGLQRRLVMTPASPVAVLARGDSVSDLRVACPAGSPRRDRRSDLQNRAARAVSPAHLGAGIRGLCRRPAACYRRAGQVRSRSSSRLRHPYHAFVAARGHVCSG